MLREAAEQLRDDKHAAVKSACAWFSQFLFAGGLTCELTGTVGYDGVWGRMKWSPKRRHAPLLPVERMVRPLGGIEPFWQEPSVTGPTGRPLTHTGATTANLQYWRGKVG